MKSKLKLKLTFLSDWQVGEGAGSRGHIDAIIRRHSQDGLPYVPAKTLTGIWRDGCERVAFGLDSRDRSGPWHQLLRELFGSNAEDQDNAMRFAKLSIEPARFDTRLRDALSAQPELSKPPVLSELSEALVFLKPGVKLDDQGVAERQMLRFEEVALAGAELAAPCELDLAGRRREQALALLCAGAMAVERLGANRRRGHGRCRLILSGGPAGKAIAKALRSTPATLDAAPSSAPDFLINAAIKTDGLGWHLLTLELDLETPVVVPDKTLGNVVTTRDHIPGSLLLPAINGWLHALLGARTTSALAAGAVQVKNAYPLADGERLVPVPSALFRLKDGDAYSVHLTKEPSDQRQRKQQREGFVGLCHLPIDSKRKAGQQRQRAVYQVDRVAVTHATIADEDQRPSSAVGGVFTYEAIHPRQRFAAQLLIAKDLAGDLPRKWLDACPATIRIGRAKKDDYGRVRLSCRKQGMSAPPAEEDQLSVWLASPLLLRDASLAPAMDAAAVTSALNDAITNALKGASGESEDSGTGDILRLEKAFLRACRDDGWNNAWQMQRQSRFGLSSGSCLRYRINRKIPAQVLAQVLAQVQARGLGERRAEGYGELLLNAPLLALTEIDTEVTENPQPGAAETNPGLAEVPATQFTRALQLRAGRLAVRRCVDEQEQQFRQALGWGLGQPPNTQLGALRAQFEGLTDESGLARVRGWLRSLDNNTDRQGKWPPAALRTLLDHLNDRDAIWRALGMPNGPQALPGHDRAALATQLRVEALRALWLTAVSRQLNENNRRQRQQSQEVADGTQA